MLKFLSTTYSNAFSFFVPTVLGTLFFFTIIGVFGIWLAIGGLLFAVILALAIVGRTPVEGDAR
jgi:uncharacterized membrane protein YccF (DUF307 family)